MTAVVKFFMHSIAVDLPIFRYSSVDIPQGNIQMAIVHLVTGDNSYLPEEFKTTLEGINDERTNVFAIEIYAEIKFHCR